MARKMKDTLPLVTVIIPVYNGAPYLTETIHSVTKNKYPNYEVILVDDGSTDTSRAMCRRLAKTDKRVRFYGFDQNRGMDHALNFAVAKAKGKYIARLNQDDLILPDRLALQVEFLEQNPDHVAIGGQITLFTGKNNFFANVNFPLTDEQIKANWLILSPFSDPTVMYRKDAFLKTSGYHQEMWPADDVHLWYRLGKLGKLANLPQVITLVRWHENCGSIKSHRRQMEKTWAVHQWASRHVQKANFVVRLFWTGQYLAGVVFPPQFNWFVYRQIKQVQSFFLDRNRTSFKQAVAAVKNVISQPRAASLSGA